MEQASANNNTGRPSATRLTSTGLALTTILTLQIHLLQLLSHMYQFSHQLHHSSVFPLLCQLLLHLLLQHQNSLLFHLSAWYLASTILLQILHQYLHQLHQQQLHRYQLLHCHYPHLHMSTLKPQFGLHSEVYLIPLAFHWSQALWRRIQDEGLAPTYRQRKNTSKHLRELMCLPFLPAEKIVQTFRDFQNFHFLLPTHPEALHKVVQYTEDNWINSSIWDPSCWSVFGRAVRTNNDTEVWHHHLNILCEKIGHNNINLW